MPETQNTEHKSSWHDNCLKWICGFANTQFKRAAIVLFGKDTGHFYSNIFVKIGKFEDDDFTVRFQEACNYSAKSVQCVQKSRNIFDK